jgi:hypothetical protein
MLSSLELRAARKIILILILILLLILILILLLILILILILMCRVSRHSGSFGTSNCTEWHVMISCFNAGIPLENTTHKLRNASSAKTYR